MYQFDDSSIDEQQKLQRSTILRVYNYYRILIAFLFLFLFLDPNLSEFVGKTNPDLFQSTIIIYIMLNVLIGVTTLFVSVDTLAKITPSLTILIGDIICLTLLMSASGGVSSGLGNFLIFTLAFGGGLVHGRVSTVLPAIAFILTIYDEFYLFFLDANDLQSFFQAGMLGIVYFVTNILFQTLSRQLRNRQTEVSTLEQINQLIVEKMRTGIVVITKDNKARLINQAAENLLTVPENPIPPREALPEKLIEQVQAWKESHIQSTVPFSISKQGAELIASFSDLTTPSPDADTLIFLEDSSEVQKQAQQLKLAALGRLSASIAHEIRNPLGAISHAGQLLSESENLDKADARLCEIIQNHSVRMNNVIENVLQLSRRKTAEPRLVALDQWLHDFVAEFSMGSHETPQIDVELTPTDTEVMVDPLHLSQVLTNLCQNGIRYSIKKTGNPRLLIRGGRDEFTDLAFIEIVDYGEGVSEDQEPNLFEPFYTTETTGTGLGLYLSKELCEANEARLSYSRAETGGSAFRITFFQEMVWKPKAL